MNKQTKWILIVIGSLSLLATGYGFFRGQDTSQLIMGGVLGLSLIVLPMMKSETNE